MVHSLPNVLTLARIAVIPLLVALFYVRDPAAPFAAAGLFLLAAATDWLDGAIARARDQQSAFGRFLDPIADKLLIAAALLMMVGFGQIADWAILPALVILCREITVSGLREFLAELRVALPVTHLAKWKTALQMIAITVLLIGDSGPAALHLRTVGEVALWCAAALTLITGYDYLRAGLGHMRLADAAVGELERR